MSVRVELVDGHVGIVQFSNPPHNFFDSELLWAILEAYKTLGNDGRTRSIVLCSEGKHFCAGANFRQSAESKPGASERPHLYAIGLELFKQPLPVVAALQGSTVGGGLGLALTADFRVSTPAARLTANFARVGLHQGFGLSATLPRLVGQQFAQEMLYTGRDVSGIEAYDVGLVDRVVPDDRLVPEAVAYACEIAKSAPLAVRSIRSTLRDPLIAEVEQVIERELTEQTWLRTTNDFKLGVAAKRDEVIEFKGT